MQASFFLKKITQTLQYFCRVQLRYISNLGNLLFVLFLGEYKTYCWVSDGDVVFLFLFFVWFLLSKKHFHCTFVKHFFVFFEQGSRK